MHHQPELRLAQNRAHFKKQLRRLSLLLLSLSVVEQYGQVLLSSQAYSQGKRLATIGGMWAWGDLQPIACNMQSATRVASGLSATTIDSNISPIHAPLT